MLDAKSNKLLVDSQNKRLSKLDPKLVQSVKKAVMAGETIMYQSKNDILTQQLTKSNDVAHNVGEGATKLVTILYQQSKKTMPMNVMGPTAFLLMLEGLDFLEKAGKIKVTPDLLDEATKDFGSSFLQLFGVTPEKMQSMIAAKQGGQPQPPTPPAGILAGA